jgi:hypothetical protein
LPGQLTRRLSRLRATSIAELTHRIRYKAFCSVERRRHRAGTLSSPDRLRSALLPSLQTRPDWQDRLIDERVERADAFFAGAAMRSSMLALFDREFACERRAAIAAADRVLNGEVGFFGQTFRFERHTWNLDPVTRVEWPRRYHRDVPISGGNRGFGDVKYVWELNRHQFLMDLADAEARDRRPDAQRWGQSSRSRGLVRDGGG